MCVVRIVSQSLKELRIPAPGNKTSGSGLNTSRKGSSGSSWSGGSTPAKPPSGNYFTPKRRDQTDAKDREPTLSTISNSFIMLSGEQLQDCYKEDAAGTSSASCSLAPGDSLPSNASSSDLMLAIDQEHPLNADNVDSGKSTPEPHKSVQLAPPSFMFLQLVSTCMQNREPVQSIAVVQAMLEVMQQLQLHEDNAAVQAGAQQAREWLRWSQTQPPPSTKPKSSERRAAAAAAAAAAAGDKPATAEAGTQTVIAQPDPPKRTPSPAADAQLQQRAMELRSRLQASQAEAAHFKEQLAYVEAALAKAEQDSIRHKSEAQSLKAALTLNRAALTRVQQETAHLRDTGTFPHQPPAQRPMRNSGGPSNAPSGRQRRLSAPVYSSRGAPRNALLHSIPPPPRHEPPSPPPPPPHASRGTAPGSSSSRPHSQTSTWGSSSQANLSPEHGPAPVAHSALLSSDAHQQPQAPLLPLLPAQYYNRSHCDLLLQGLPGLQGATVTAVPVSAVAVDCLPEYAPAPGSARSPPPAVSSGTSHWDQHAAASSAEAATSPGQQQLMLPADLVAAAALLLQPGTDMQQRGQASSAVGSEPGSMSVGQQKQQLYMQLAEQGLPESLLSDASFLAALAEVQAAAQGQGHGLQGLDHNGMDSR
jgi:hypothetical protein